VKAVRFTATALLAVLVISVTGPAIAGEKIKVKGRIKDYDISNKTLVIETDGGKKMTFVIEDAKELNKFGFTFCRHDVVRIKYVVKEGRNVIDGTDDIWTTPSC
jgi:hypothetical protein